jgi:hypothetical protein
VKPVFAVFFEKILTLFGRFSGMPHGILTNAACGDGKRRVRSLKFPHAESADSARGKSTKSV